MSMLKPENGLVIKFDFLWKEEASRGQIDGSKEHPCAVVVARNEQPDGSVKVIVCAISHTPPRDGQGAIEIPYKDAKKLGLDHNQMWIKTHEVNIFTWEKDQLPFGIAKAPNGTFSYGKLSPGIYDKMRGSVIENSRSKNLAQIKRGET